MSRISSLSSVFIRVHLWLLLAFIFCISCGAPQEGMQTQNLIIATATPGGTYYPVGVALSTTITQKLQPKIVVAAINSAGSAENIQMLVNREAHLAILLGLYGAMAYRGERTYQGQAIRDLRSITLLWENVEHFLLLASDAKTGTVEDLRGLGRKYVIGKRGSGTEGATRTILAALNISPDEDFTSEYLGYGPSAQAMIDGRIAGATLSAGPPVAAVTQAFAQLGADEVSVLAFSDDHLVAIQNAFPMWTRYVIPANTYPGQSEAIETIAQPNFLACRADLPEDVVYEITKTIYENLAEIQNIHKATLAMSLEKATMGLAVPLHAGAARYYSEKGIDISPSLIGIEAGD